jgi:hypothetical protein
MTTQAGVWIDHRKAIVVILSGEDERLKEVASGVERHVRYSRAAAQDSAEDQRDRRFVGHLNKYYDEVIEQLEGAESILILGPGEAKVELEERLRKEALRERIVGIETVDKMTDRQVAARVRQRFLKSKRRLGKRVAV